MIKINLVREGRAVRGAGAAAAGPSVSAAAGPSNLNNLLIIGLTIAGILTAGVMWFTTDRTLKERQGQVAERQATAQKLESIIKEVEDYQKRKDNLQKRIDLINQLKQNQKGPVRIMDRISQDLPDLVWLDRMTVGAGQISVSGRGLNPNAIANFVENVKNDPYFEEPELSNMTQVSTKPLVYGFDMTFGFSYAPAGAEATAGTPGTTSTSSTSDTAPTATAAPGGKS